jgi:hypothetical protein
MLSYWINLIFYLLFCPAVVQAFAMDVPNGDFEDIPLNPGGYSTAT